MTLTSRRSLLIVLALAGFAVLSFGSRAIAQSVEPAPPTGPTASDELSLPKAVVLGVVEGVTEFLPISSTGHLLVTERLLDIGTTSETKEAADTYAIAIQSGAILAVLLLYRRRVWSMVEGVVGRDPAGRTTAVAVIIAVIPAALVALVFESPIKEHLLEPVPVIIAWVVGGVLLLLFARRWDERPEGIPLEQIAPRQALIIGIVQCLALWPGTSRSLVTIVAALAVGLTLAAAVEFSFLLGLVTLGAATVYELVKHGDDLFATYSGVSIVVGLVVAFAAAAIAITWMVRYLQHHSLALFGWYRIGIAALALVLLATGTL